MKRGVYGLKPDIYIGLIGSIELAPLSGAIGLSPNAGIVAMAFVAFIGAALAIVAQRTPATQSSSRVRQRGRSGRWGGARLRPS